MKVGFIGFGKSVHRYHLPFIAEVEEIEVIGYYTRGQSKFEMPMPGSEQIERFADLDRLLASDADLIIICTPVLHYEFATLALKAGKHVLCEKPLCNTLEQAEELYRLAADAGVLLCPYQNRRFDSDFTAVFDVIESGRVGVVAEIISNHTQDRLVATNQPSQKYNGMVYGHAVHFVDQIVSKYGQPEALIYNSGNQRDYLYGGIGDVDDYYHILMIYPNLRVGVNFNAIALKEPPRWTVYGSEATLEKYGIDRQEVYLKAGRYPGDSEFGMVPADERVAIYTSNRQPELIAPKVDTYAQFYRQLERAITSGSELPVSEHQAKVVINILETIVENKQYQKI